MGGKNADLQGQRSRVKRDVAASNDSTAASPGVLPAGELSGSSALAQAKVDATAKANAAQAAAIAASQPVNTKLTALSAAATTVAGLPGATGSLERRFVTDALGPTFGAAVVGGGAVKSPVYDDGAWKVG